MKLAWLTDIHLNFLGDEAEDFIKSLADTESDAFLIGGDIGEAHDIFRHLNAMDNFLQRPVYFVLGNHDFYRGTIAGVLQSVRDLCEGCPNLHYLADAGVVPLTDRACLVGHGGWGDGRFGDYAGSTVMLNDWGLIGEFGGFHENLHERLLKLNALGDEAAAHVRSVLPDALERFEHVVVLTHVPPFKEACWHEGAISNDEWLPHFTCKAVGDALREAMQEAPDRRMTVLCGHTHGSGEAQILPNLRVLTGGTHYGNPEIQQMLEVD